MFMGLKTAKEAQRASFEYLRAFENQTIGQIDGTFIPSNPIELHQYLQRYLWAAIVFGLVAGFLSIQAFTVDAIHYWHVDPYVVVGVSIIVAFWGVFAWCLRQYFRYNQWLRTALSNPNQYPYGVLITEDYYFERKPQTYHIIPRANIVRIDYEEARNKGEHYMELLLEWEDRYEVRGILYQPEVYDFKNWINQRPQTVSK